MYEEKNGREIGRGENKFHPMVSFEADKQLAIKEKIKAEQMEAREMFGELIQMVNARYEKMPAKMREEFVKHNKEILNSAIELAIKNKFEPGDLKMLEMAAIWHDARKADEAPEEYKDIAQYVLVTHGEKAAEEIPDILTDSILRNAGFPEAEFQNVRLQVSDAILQHMGPHPGFMTNILNGVNEKLRAKGKQEIFHPNAEGKISEALLAADMRALAGVSGRKKVLEIRASVPFFMEQDKKIVEEYAKYEVSITPGEAALISGFDSAKQALDMIRQGEAWELVNDDYENSKLEKYELPGSERLEVTGEEVLNKQSLFNLKKQQAENGEAEMEKLAA